MTANVVYTATFPGLIAEATDAGTVRLTVIGSDGKTSTVAVTPGFLERVIAHVEND
jgi:hypothetical protein